VTYCAAITVEDGLVFISDSRTNAGVDNISTYSKMNAFGVPGERQIVICSAGNLATSQAVMLQVERDIEDNTEKSLYNFSRMSDIARYIGELSVKERLPGEGAQYGATFLVGGEIANARCRVFMVYPEGNFIASSRQTPFLQIGEVKYGKPILDRVINASTELEEAALCALLSMDATTRSNMTVGPPVELYIYKKGTLQPGRYVCFGEEDEFLRILRRAWNDSITQAFRKMPKIPWSGETA
jgi:putative proteasome-type protease